MNLTYYVAGLQVIFAIVGMAFGWLDSAVGTGLILAGLGVFGAKFSQNNTTSAGGVW